LGSEGRKALSDICPVSLRTILNRNGKIAGEKSGYHYQSLGADSQTEIAFGNACLSTVIANAQSN
jgi:hypothetical protein